MNKVLNSRSNFKVRKFTGDTSAEERDTLVAGFNRNDFNILLITKAGGEGLDLKGVRNIFILEGQWNMSVIDQAAARGIRCKSHTHLVPSERNATVYYMAFNKPPVEKRQEIVTRMSEKDPLFLELTSEQQNGFINCKEMEQSADQLLFEISVKKMKVRDRFMSSLERFSIENFSSCGM